MSSTSHLNTINIQVMAEDQMKIDIANGTYNANVESDSKYYFWTGDHQTIPLGMNGNPEQFVTRIATALPTVNCLRVSFNKNSFNADGSLHEDFERFLDAAAAKGFKLIMLLADGDAQEFEGSPSETHAALDGPILEGMKTAWSSMMKWMAEHENVKKSVYGWELVNEPASYASGIGNLRFATAAQKAEFVGLYVEHMKELGDIVKVGSDAKILVNLFGYAGQSEILAEPLLGGRSAIDLLRDAFSDDLVWSAHFYAGWRGTGSATSSSEIIAALRNFLYPLGDDDIILTETNAPGSSTFNPYSGSQATSATALAFDWLAKNGVGLGWFPGVQTGGSNLATIWGNGTINYLHQSSLAAALNAFSFGDTDSSLAGTAFDGVTRLVSARLRNEATDPDYQLKNFDAVRFAGFAFGSSNADTIVGNELANNFLYGGGNRDTILGAKNDDFIFGQDGNDELRSGEGFDHLFGGAGQDTLHSEGAFCRMYGGSEADLFVISSSKDVEIIDFNVRAGDRWIVSGNSTIISVQNVDVNRDYRTEQIVSFTNGLSVVLFLDTSGVNAGQSRSPLLSKVLPVGLETVSGSLSFGAATADTMTASDGQATLFGGAANDTLFGGAQNDALHGGANSDSLLGMNGSDALFGEAGFDRLKGGVGVDFLSGGSNSDQLFGGSGSDSLLGGEGSDLLHGGRGNDVLSGGKGADHFLFNSSDGRDTISDFSIKFDTIHFQGITRSDVDVTIRQGNCLITYDGGRIVLFDVDRAGQVERILDFM